MTGKARPLGVGIGTVAVLLLFATHAPAASGVYRWVDARGVVHYSDTPPQPSARQDPPEVEKARRAVVDETLLALTAGDFDRIITRYRLFDDSRDAAWVAENRRLLKRYFTLLRTGLGRPVGFQAAGEFSPDFQMDPVPDRVWDQSDCSISEHAYTVTLVDRDQRRPADLFVRTCYATSTGKTWLRSVTILVGRPVQAAFMKALGTSPPAQDAVFDDVMTRFMKEMMESCARRPEMDSCASSPGIVLPATPTKEAPKPDAPAAPKGGGPDAPKPAAGAAKR